MLEDMPRDKVRVVNAANSSDSQRKKEEKKVIVPEEAPAPKSSPIRKDPIVQIVATELVNSLN